ncbi:GlcNAc-PI de-N-acetylase [Mycobacterium sp. 852002-51163_SCH5372311]|uniref:PIG-L deacetylase family protein n=1 Tax=Mycobacterium sp. 852002-51163_SCH5372311 TaxID=1834097 RepID=UPI0007FCC386|nr:PIG-L deacetylase family protein [Mycobacterium sp. 852002-51163_SCH5372311]OBF86139.1 GlcNAc-PI de-N-acetylase [Mycobacterium sp. 852002-51163_SCH5372311]
MNSSPLEHFPQDWRRALAVVAHPDDVEYGLAAAVAGFTAQGKQVAYLLASRGEAGIDDLPPEQTGPQREAEQRAAAAVVGVEHVDFLDYPDGTIMYSLALRRDIAAAIRRYRPELVLTLNHHDHWPTGGWNMADHRAVGVAAIDAARDAGNRWIFPELADQGLLAWGGVTMVAIGGSPHATHAVDVTDTFQTGMASLAEHRGYLAALGADSDPMPMLRDMAQHAGQRLGTDLAAAFEIVHL